MKQHLERRQDWIRGRREKRKQARHARLRRQVLRYSLLLLLVGTGVCGFTHMPWRISDLHQDVWIHGNNVVTNQQVLKTLTPALNQPLYKLDPAKLEAAVASLPAVNKAFVRRYVLPRPQLKVEILEEFPWATYCPTPESAPEGVIAQTGRYIPLSQFPAVAQPALRVCGEKGLKLKPSEIGQWDNWVRLIEAQTGQPVMLVDMRSPTAIQAFSGGYELHLGSVDSTLNRRLGRLSSVMPVIATLKEPLKYIDLSLDSNIPLKVDKSGKKGNEMIAQPAPPAVPM